MRIARAAGLLVLVLSIAACSIVAMPPGQLGPAGAPPAVQGPASVVQDLKEISYFPADGGWAYMWSNFDPAVINRDFARIRALGANTVRIFVEPSVFGFPTVRPLMADRLSEVIGLAAEHSLQIQLDLFDLWHQFTDISGSKEWISSLLSRYRHDPRIAVVELHNEINPLQHQAVAWVIKMLPYLSTVLPGTLRTVSVASVPPWEFAVLTRELKNSPPDFWDYHYYGPASNAYTLLIQIKGLAAPRPLFIGETGYSTNRPAGDAATLEQEQAAYLRAVFEAAARLNLARPALWILNDFTPGAIPPDSTADNPAEYGYGLFEVNGTPKPAAAVVRQEFTRK